MSGSRYELLPITVITWRQYGKIFNTFGNNYVINTNIKPLL